MRRLAMPPLLLIVVHADAEAGTGAAGPLVRKVSNQR